MRVCYFGTYRDEYSRNQIMIAGLRSAQVEVLECHEQLWDDIEDRVQAASGGWIKPRFWWRVLKVYLRLIWRYLRTGDHDAVIVGYPGQFDVFLARGLSWLRHKPLAWDIFMSIYLIAIERQLDQKSRFTTNALRKIERAACRLPDLLILDTAEYVGWFTRTHQVPPERFRLVATGADDRVFHPISKPRSEDGLFWVIYYGTFIPNHGVTYIVEAARLLEDDSQIQFELVGSGPEREKAEQLVEQYGLKNVTFTDWLDKDELVEKASQAEVCLGAFGTTPQSIMTVQNKIYEGLAMAKPVISGDSAAVRQNLEHGKHIYLCERANPQALAEAICELKSDKELQKRLAENGRLIFIERFTIARLGVQFKSHLQQTFTKIAAAE